MIASKDFEEETIRRSFLALWVLVLAGVVPTVRPSPADAATTFTVNKTSDAKDRNY